jgi:hypothetical protein
MIVQATPRCWKVVASLDPNIPSRIGPSGSPSPTDFRMVDRMRCAQKQTEICQFGPSLGQGQDGCRPSARRASATQGSLWRIHPSFQVKRQFAKPLIAVVHHAPGTRLDGGALGTKTARARQRRTHNHGFVAQRTAILKTRGRVAVGHEIPLLNRARRGRGRRNRTSLADPRTASRGSHAGHRSTGTPPPDFFTLD